MQPEGIFTLQVYILRDDLHPILCLNTSCVDTDGGLSCCCSRSNKQWVDPANKYCVSKTWFILLLCALEQNHLSHTFTLTGMFLHYNWHGHCGLFCQPYKHLPAGVNALKCTTCVLIPNWSALFIPVWVAFAKKLVTNCFREWLSLFNNETVYLWPIF